MKNLLIGIYQKSDMDTELLIQYLKIAEVALDMTFEIRTYSTGEDLLHAYCPVFDILFLELPVSDMDSETLLAQIRQRDSLVQIILISKSNDLYRLGYEYNARNYFTKPIWYRNIYHELERIFAEDHICRRPYLWISNQQGNYKLYLHKLRYLETSNRQLSLHYGSEEILFCGKISDFEEKLSSGRFFRCNNSYLVNLDYIEAIHKDGNRYCINLVSGEIIPLSRDRKRELEGMIERE